MVVTEIARILITPEMVARAEKRFDFGVLNNSVTKGDGNIGGALGEIVVMERLGKKYHVENVSTFDYDLIVNGFKIDVKTKRFSEKFTPNSNWNLNIFDFNTTQGCDYYLFVGVAEDYSVAYLYGLIKKDLFYEKAIFGKKGEACSRGNGEWKYKGDCYNIKISELTHRKF